MKKPLYLKLVSSLKSHIQKNMHKDQKLLGEREIAEHFNVSRYTVRQALDELEKAGYIYKVHGKGTFVSEKSVPTALNEVYSFTEQMKSLGKVPETNLLEFKVFNSGKQLSSKLKINLGNKVIRLKFLRKADQVPMMIEKTYLPFAKFSTLTLNDLENNSLYSVMSKTFHQSIHLVSESIRACLISNQDADLLSVEHHSPCLEVNRTSYNKLQEPIEYTFCTARSDQFVYNYKYIHYDKK